MNEFIFIILIVYVVFKDVLRYYEIKRLQALLYERMTLEEKKLEKTRIEQDRNRELENEDLVPFEGVEPEKALEALRKEQL